jgi:adenosylcobinamide-phosphate synthase
MPFVAEPGGASLMGRLPANTILLNSLSKIFRIPGLRIGFLVAAEPVIQRLRPFMLPWNVNALAQEAVLWLGDHPDQVKRFIARTVATLETEKHRLFEALNRLPGITVFPSSTAYLLARLGDGFSAAGVAAALLEKRILVRNCSNFKGLSERYIRFSLKTESRERSAAATPQGNATAMMDTAGIWWILPAALLLDLVLGDPRWLPHPVRWMGSAIERLEPFFRKLPLPPVGTGLLFAATLVAATWMLAAILLCAADFCHPVMGDTFRVVLLYYAVSARSLEQAAMAVAHRIDDGDIEGAREKVSWIVGRETAELGRGGIIRGAVETVAENFVDGVLAPLFFAVIGGVPLAMAYKMTNTMDSMIGYKNSEYLHFGKGAARLDDLLNWFPARLSVPVIALAARLLAGRGRQAIETARREGHRHASPNAGYPEAAFAGALGVRLNGPNRYHGTLVDKPFIGRGNPFPRNRHIRQACDLMLSATLIGGGGLALLAYLASLLP